LVKLVEDLWEHAERYRLLHREHGGEQTHVARLVQSDHAAVLEAAEQGDAAAAAKYTAGHLARTALMTLINIDPRHEPTRVRAALEHVYAEDPTAATPVSRSTRPAAVS
jgi:DNA-binding GntR family transcriptional regulator